MIPLNEVILLSTILVDVLKTATGLIERWKFLLQI